MDDLIIGRNGKVATLILSVGRGALLEFDEKLVTLPFKPLKVNGAGIVYEVTPQQLKGLPGFHYEKK